MLSDSQKIEIISNVKKIVNIYLTGDKSILEVASLTGISKSCIQRYLNNEEYFMLAFGNDYKIIFDKVHEMIKINYEKGTKLGGKNFAKNNIPKKDEIGRFTGSIKK